MIGLSKKLKALMDMDNTVVIVGIRRERVGRGGKNKYKIIINKKHFVSMQRKLSLK